MKSSRLLMFGSAAALAFVIAAVAMFEKRSDRHDPRSLVVTWGPNAEFQQPALTAIATSDTASDRRIVTTITRTVGGTLVHQGESVSTFDALEPDSDADMTPGPMKTSETSLSLNNIPSGTGLTITTQFYDVAGALMDTKVATVTKP